MELAALWERYQDWLYYHEGLGIYVDVSRMSFDDPYAEQLMPKFEQAFAAMDELEKGAIANPDEGRMVGHYWLRAPELAPSEELKKDIVETLESLESFAEKIRAAKSPLQISPNSPIFSLSALAARPWVRSSSLEL